MTRTTRIYCIHDATDNYSRCYIGKTINALSTRFAQHRHSAGRVNRPIADWLYAVTYRGGNPTITELEQVVDAGSEAERWWITYFRSLGFRLLNYTDGGEGISGYKHTAATLERLRLAGVGRPSTPETRKKIGAATRAAWADGRITGHPASPKQIDALVTRNQTRVYSDKDRTKLSELRRNISEDTRQKMRTSAANRAPITEVTRERLRKKRVGRKHTKETIEKMRTARCAYWRNRRNEEKSS